MAKYFKYKEEEVTLYETTFENSDCKDFLNRKALSKYLSEIVEKFEDPLVIALNGGWGTGKSYFLQRWVGAHTKDNGGKVVTVYFDAFKNDYLSEPLISLISAFTERFPKNESITKLKKFGAIVAATSLKSALAIASFGASEQLGKAAGAVIDVIKGVTQEEIDNLWTVENGRKEAFDNFRKQLSKLATEEQPLVIVIDELDRCRPDYALELLEVIKHFFSVPHVHFVLGVNLKALENSVKARYGSGIDAEQYLQKFISFTIEIPIKHTNRSGRQMEAYKEYISYIGSRRGIEKTFLDKLTSQLSVINVNQEISLRTADKMLSLISLLPNSAKEEWVADLVVTLIITRVLDKSTYKKLLDLEISDSELKTLFRLTDVSSTNVGDFIKSTTETGKKYRLSLVKYTKWRYIQLDGQIKTEFWYEIFRSSYDSSFEQNLSRQDFLANCHLWMLANLSE